MELFYMTVALLSPKVPNRVPSHNRAMPVDFPPPLSLLFLALDAHLQKSLVHVRNLVDFGLIENANSKATETAYACSLKVV